MDYYVVKFNSAIPFGDQHHSSHEMVLYADGVSDAERKAKNWLASRPEILPPVSGTMKIGPLRDFVFYDGRFYEKPEEKKYDTPMSATEGLSKPKE